MVRIADSGRGIAEADLPRVFERYFRGANQGEGETAGTGLGLSIAHKIAVLHGGRIGVESALGQGSVFTLRLPLASDVD